MLMNTWIIISTVEFIAVVALVVLIIIRSNKQHPQKESEKMTPSIERPNWVRALHGKVCNQWLTQFSEISYPITTEEKAELFALLWNVASVSIDCLMVDCGDENRLQRHQDSVLYLTGETDNWENLKEFHRDPSTVPYQVIAIYDILKELGYNGKAVAFGYQLILD